MELTAYRRVVLDTTACIYFLEGGPDDKRRRLLEPLVRAGEKGKNELLVSALTVTELLTGPLRIGNRIAEARARLFVAELCRIVPVDAAVAEVAAHFRARYGLRTPDALICATGVEEKAEAVIGNDSRWKPLTEINYVHIDDLI